MGDRFCPVCRDNNGVLDSYAPETGNVRAWLNRDDQAGSEDTHRPGRQDGLLVDLEADAVTGAVDELLGKVVVVHLVVGQMGPAHAVNLSFGHTISDRRDAGSLCSGHGGIERLLLVCWLADTEGSGHVAAVTVDAGTKVDHHKIAFHKGSIAWASMWQRRVRTARHDRVETQGICPVVEHRSVEVELKGPLGDTRLKSTNHRSESFVGNGRCLLKPGPLARVFELSKLCDNSAGRHELRVWHVFVCQPFRELSMVSNTQAVIEAEPGGPEPGGQLMADVSDAEVHIDEIAEPGSRELSFRLFAVATIGKQRDVVVGDQQAAVRAGESGEPADIDRCSHPQCLSTGDVAISLICVSIRLPAVIDQPFSQGVEPADPVHRWQLH